MVTGFKDEVQEDKIIQAPSIHDYLKHLYVKPDEYADFDTDDDAPALTLNHDDLVYAFGRLAKDKATGVDGLPDHFLKAN